MASEQSRGALAKANRVRLARADMKRDLKAGKASIQTVLHQMPDFVSTMSVGELLSAQYRWRITRARKFLKPLEISETRKIGDLTIRQRQLISDALAEDQMRVLQSRYYKENQRRRAPHP